MDQDLKTPLVSITMLTLNRARYIGAAIESVLNQDYENWELLILDSGSRDNTEQVITKYLNDARIKYFKPADDLGLTGNRNYALSLSRGKYIAVLDSDDVWISDEKLEAEVNFLEQNSNYVLVGTNFERIDESGKILEKVTLALSDKEIRENLLLRNEFAHSSTLFRKSALDLAKSYDQNLFIWEDYDLWFRLGLLGKMANLPEFMTAYRKHPGGISGARKVKGARTIIKIIKKYRKSYPHFYKAYFKAWLRVFARAIGL